MDVAAGVMMNGDEAGNAAALLIFAAHRVARALGGILERFPFSWHSRIG